MPRLFHHFLGGKCFEEWGELCVPSPVSCSLLLSGVHRNHCQHWAVADEVLIGVRATSSYYTTDTDIALPAATTSYMPSDPYRSRVSFSTKISESFADGYCLCVHLVLWYCKSFCVSLHRLPGLHLLCLDLSFTLQVVTVALCYMEYAQKLIAVFSEAFWFTSFFLLLWIKLECIIAKLIHTCCFKSAWLLALEL